jgi:hypothetical protein
MKTGVKIALWVGGIAIVVPLVGYFIFKGMKSRLEKDREKDKIDTAKQLKDFDKEFALKREKSTKPPTWFNPK